MKNTFKKLIIAFLITCLGIYTISCTKRILVPMNRDSLENEDFLHVKLTSGKEVKVKDPRLENGVLIGLTPVYETRPGPYKEIKVFFDQIDSIEAERFSLKKTFITLAGIALILGIFSFYLSQYEEGGFN